MVAKIYGSFLYPCFQSQLLGLKKRVRVFKSGEIFIPQQHRRKYWKRRKECADYKVCSPIHSQFYYRVGPTHQSGSDKGWYRSRKRINHWKYHHVPDHGLEKILERIIYNRLYLIIEHVSGRLDNQWMQLKWYPILLEKLTTLENTVQWWPGMSRHSMQQSGSASSKS